MRYLSFLYLGVMVSAYAATDVVDSHHCDRVIKNRPFLLVLKRGEDFISTILHCVSQAKLSAAVVSGAVGALHDPTVAYFALSDKKYHSKKLPGDYEIVATNGNVGWAKGKRFAHIHVALGGSDYRLYGGHLMTGKVAVVAELMITPLIKPAIRKYDASLHLMPITPEYSAQ